jgi:plasmid stabilization system protein ParE
VRVIWTPEAEQDRADVWDYIAADNPRAAARMDELFSDAAATLAAHCQLGKPGKISGRRDDLTGGGLIRSIGGWKEFTARRSVNERMQSDERILGDGDFVENVLQEAEEALERKEQYRSSVLALIGFLVWLPGCII